MNICIENPEEIAKALKVWFANQSESQEAIADRLELNQSQVSRVLSGDFSRITKPVRTVCNYAKIKLIKAQVDPKTNERIMSALEKAWDGSDSHANLIAKVIIALGK